MGVQMNGNRNIDIFKQLSKFSVIQQASSLRGNLSCNKLGAIANYLRS